MRIYRASGFVVLEDIGAYIVNQLVAFKLANNIHIRVEYSLDDGNTWLTLIPENEFFGENHFVCDWVVIPPTAKMSDVLVRALGIVAGLLTTIKYAEMSFD